MKNNFKKILIFSVLSMVSMVASCGNDEKPLPEPPEDVKYKVTFDLNGGSGEAPVMEPQKEGAIFTIPGTTSEKNGYSFDGWKEGNVQYDVGAQFTMPARDVVFTANWTEVHIPKPSFSEQSYEYDRVAGGNLELPISLDGAGFYYLEIDNQTVPYSKATYDDSKSCIVVKEDYVLTLNLGEHYVKAVTDGDEEPATCVLKITNSITSNFDETTRKLFKKGYMDRVEFTVDFKNVTVTSLVTGDHTVDEKYYGVEGDKFFIKAEWLEKFYGETEYTVHLSNRDSYNFTIDSNVLFYTDYDVTTIHDPLESTIGHNSLYQYSTPESIQIVEGVEGISGKALKYTPNYSTVPLDCNRIFTLKSPSCPYMWHELPMREDKNYVFSFDYMTVGTTVGKFSVNAENNSWSENLLLGAENDNTLHHYSRIIKGNEVGYGFSILAFFENGSGYTLFDNVSVTEIDEVPELNAIPDYKYVGDIVTTFDPKGLDYTLKLDGSELPRSVASENTITIPEETAKTLSAGKHTLTLETVFGSISQTFTTISDLLCEITTTSATHNSRNAEGPRFEGKFDSVLDIKSVHMIDSLDESVWADWDFRHANVEKDYKDEVTLVKGDNNTGYIQFSKKLAESIYQTTEFEIEFNNGATRRVSITNNYEMFSNYDDTSMLAYLGGGYNQGMILNMGLWNDSVTTVKEYEEGNKGLSCTSTAGAAEACMYTVRYHDHPWMRYQINSDTNYMYRTSFKYRITNLAQDSVYFMFMTPPSELNEYNIFGEYDSADYIPGDDYYKVRFNLIADGQLHEFVSPFYTTNNFLRMTQIQMPTFSASDNAEVLIDDYTVEKQLLVKDPITETEYIKNSNKDLTFTSDSEVKKILVDQEEIEFTKENSTYKISSTLLEGLTLGEHEIVLVYDDNVKILHKINVTDDARVATLTETSKNVTYKGGAVKLAGEFDPTLTVESFKRKGTSDWDNTSGRLNVNTSDGSMNLDYVTIETDGITLNEEVVNQVFGTMPYEITLSNKKVLNFSLTSNQLYYSNFNETYCYVDVVGAFNMPSCQDTSMSQIIDVEGVKHLRYTPSDAVLGHALGADNRILTFSVEGRTNWWWTYSFGTLTSESKFYIEFDYAITGTCEDYYFCYWTDNGSTPNQVLLKNNENKFYLELDANIVDAFAIGCNAFGAASAGSYMDIYTIGFGII